MQLSMSILQELMLNLKNDDCFRIEIIIFRGKRTIECRNILCEFCIHIG